MGKEVIRVPMDYDGPKFDISSSGIPDGDGYAMFQNTSDVLYSPIFATLREVCDWCAENDDHYIWDVKTQTGKTVKLTADEWFEELRWWVDE